MERTDQHLLHHTDPQLKYMSWEGQAQSQGILRLWDLWRTWELELLVTVEQGLSGPALGTGLLDGLRSNLPPSPASFLCTEESYSLCLDQALHKQKGMKVTMMRTTEPRTIPTIR